MKILVTGGAGFIGSHIVDKYIRVGHDVVVVDDLSTGDKNQVNQQAKFYQCDINSPELMKIFSNERPQLVSHHAAQISVPYSVENPIADARTNINGMLSLLECCRKTKIEKVIFSSSGGAIYGEASVIPTPEASETNPQSPYAIHKLTGEKYLAFYLANYDLNFTVLRYANVYGPRQIPSSEAGVISKFIDKLLRKEQPTLFVYPDEPEGMSRDYVNVRDIVNANVLALNRGDGEIINIGTQVMTNTSELLMEIERLMYVNIEPLRQPPRPGDIRYNCLRNEKAERVLSWRPSISLTNGLKETIDFFTKKFEEERS
jgi:UDP-glucose 4-epimerase